MGAVFLYREHAETDVNNAMAVFNRMGFTMPVSFECGGWRIMSFNKLAAVDDSFYRSGDAFIISVGMPVYKGLGYAETLAALLEDHQKGSLKYDELFGHYNLFFCVSGELTVISDEWNEKHLFTDTRFRIISSSMLAVAATMTDRLTVNRTAVYEKLLTGIIMPPDTIFNEIMQIDNSVMASINREERNVRFAIAPQKSFSEEPHKAGRAASVKAQAQTLLNYFEKLKSAAKDGVDTGLSGGYDSRLILACANKVFGDKLHLHTHNTEDVHNKDKRIAMMMAGYVKKNCVAVPTKRLNHIEDVDKTLIDNVLLFDGRTSFSIGGFSETYTANYRKTATAALPLTLTGVGGELYRNVFSVSGKYVEFRKFLQTKVFFPEFQEAVGSDIYESACRNVFNKVEKRLGIDIGAKLNINMTHRYYCEIMMPDGQGNVLDAYNQVSGCIAPFLDPSIIREGYRGLKYHVTGGDYEGAIIDFIDSGLASITSSYGYPLNSRPLKARIKERLRSEIPPSFWHVLHRIKERGKPVSNCGSYLMQVCQVSGLMKSAFDSLCEAMPEIDFGFLLKNAELEKTVPFLALSIYLIKEGLLCNE